MKNKAEVNDSKFETENEILRQKVKHSFIVCCFIKLHIWGNEL